MSSSHRCLAALAVPVLFFGLACLKDPGEAPIVEVVDTQYLDYNLTAQWPDDMPRQNPFSAGVLTSDGTRLLLSYGAMGGRGLTVLDVSQPGLLTLVADHLEVDIQLFRGEVHGDLLWVPNSDGLRIWDLSEVDGAGPSLVQEHLEIVAYDLEVVGDVVYVGNLDGLFAFDRSRLESAPATMADAVGTVPTVGAINDYTVTAQGAEWIWLGGFEGKALIDVSDPTNPTFVRSLGDLNEWQVTLVGDKLVSNGRIWNVSDPNNPEWVAFLPFSFGFQTLLDPTTLVSSSEGLVWTDFSQDPPLEVRRIETSGQFTPLSNGRAIFGIDDFFIYRIEGL